MAQAATKVPVSIRSGITACSAPRRASTPSTRIVDPPAPWMRAPMRIRRSARSATSGSQAALRMMVSPSAREAAIRTFSVPVTVTVSK
jgi:hypothetical protein